MRRGQLCKGRLGTPLGLALKIAPHDAGVGCGAAGAFRIGGNEHSMVRHRWRRMENICLSCEERRGLRTQSTRWAGSARSWAPPVEALGAARGRRKSRAMRLLSKTRLGAACCGAGPRGRAARRVRATGLSSRGPSRISDDSSVRNDRATLQASKRRSIVSLNKILADATATERKVCRTMKGVCDLIEFRGALLSPAPPIVSWCCGLAAELAMSTPLRGAWDAACALCEGALAPARTGPRAGAGAGSSACA